MVVIKNLLSVEQVGIGHPDKMCDIISDSILDECLKQDKYSRVAVEVLGKGYNFVVAGEITTNAVLDVESIVKNTLKNVIKIEDYDKYNVINLLSKQSLDIKEYVDKGLATDQGSMVGFACNETKEYMPLGYMLCNKLLYILNNNSKLHNDSKAQVTLCYDNNSISIDTFSVAVMHDDDMSLDEVRSIVYDEMINVAKLYNLNTDFNMIVNNGGKFTIGHTVADTGLTGRKIVADTYGCIVKHGGGAFSGKDPTKLDRSGAYMARYLAKNIVAAGIFSECDVTLSYISGVKEAVSIEINGKRICNHNDDNLDNNHEHKHGCCKKYKVQMIDKLKKYILDNIDLSTNGIIDRFDLRNLSYLSTTTYGHFGKEDLPYERLDLVDDFKKLV